jgi:hypothetical protein
MSTSVGPINLYMKPPIEIARTWSLSSILGPSAPPDSPGASTSTVPSSDSTATVSTGGSLLSKLESLRSTQPETFQAALTKAATGLSAAAQAGSSTPQAQLLSKSAAVIQQVASTGDLSQLQPATATNVVAKTYGPNQADSNEAVLSLLSSGTGSTTSTKDSSGSSAVASAASSSDGSADSTLNDAVSSALQDLRSALLS